MPSAWQPNNAEINKLLGAPGGLVYDHVNAFTELVVDSAKEKTPVDRGSLRASIKAKKSRFGPAGLGFLVGTSNKHAMTIHQGHRELAPVTQPYMKFQTKRQRGTGKYVRTTHVRAVGGVPFLTAALVEVNKSLPPGERFKITIVEQPRTEKPPQGLRRLNVNP